MRKQREYKLIGSQRHLKVQSEEYEKLYVKRYLAKVKYHKFISSLYH